MSHRIKVTKNIRALIILSDRMLERIQYIKSLRLHIYIICNRISDLVITLDYKLEVALKVVGLVDYQLYNI